eukprot:85355-Pyramimonas_sp.AAC.1
MCQARYSAKFARPHQCGANAFYIHAYVHALGCSPLVSAALCRSMLVFAGLWPRSLVSAGLCCSLMVYAALCCSLLRSAGL